MVSKGTSPDTQRLRTAGEMRCLQSRLPDGKAATSRRVLLKARPLLSANLLSPRPHRAGAAGAIDFTGHQIILGLAEHMPFSTGRSLSLSQINSSNYSAPPREARWEACVLLSGSWNGEMLHGCWKHAQASAAQPEIFGY